MSFEIGTLRTGGIVRRYGNCRNIGSLAGEMVLIKRRAIATLRWSLSCSRSSPDHGQSACWASPR